MSNDLANPFGKPAGEQDDRTPLHRAASNGQLLLVRKLLNEGAQVDCQDELNWTPLIIAASAGHREIVELLIASGASVSSRTTNNQTALHYAASKNRLEICKLLVEAKAELNARDNLRQTPLHRAALRGDVKLVQYLVGLPNIQLNPQDKVGNAPLHLACEDEREDIIKLLIDAGCDTTLANADKKTPVETIVTHAIKRTILNYLQQKKA